MADQRPIGFWLRLVDRLIDEQFEATLEEHGVARRQWQLLSTLANGVATVEQLEASVAPFLVAEESVVEHLTELIDSAWVADTAEGYELTERGRTAAERLGEVVGEQRAAMSAGVDAEEYASALAVLERMARNLGWNEP